MGNCCGSLSNPEMQQQDYMSPEDPEFLHQPVIRPEDDDDDDDDNDHHDHHIETTSTVTTRSNTPFQGTPFNELSTTTTTTILPFVDPRLVSLLDFSRQLYVRRKDIFNKVMPVHRKDLEAIFGEMKNMQQQEQKRSKMVGMVRQRSMSFGDEKSIKMERFKVKPIIDSKGVQSPEDGKGGAGSKPAGSK